MVNKIFIWVALLFFSVASHTQDSIVYNNPVIKGFYPDPSICRVKDDYYLVNSSFEYFPGIPLWHSKDLINWEQIGNCLTRPSQLPMQHTGASGGTFAPTIRYNNGVFYMITTNAYGWHNFFVYTSDLLKGWSEPVFVDQGGVDPSLFFDDDGKCYYSGESKAGICLFELDIKTGKKLTASKVVWTGTGDRYPEGPHIYKVKGWYYLMIAEGGTEYNHMITISRSKSIWGPYESNPKNPILSHKWAETEANPIQGTGHGDLVQAVDSTWWITFLGFRPQQGRYHVLGRETFMAPLEWVDEWPVVNNTGTVDLKMKIKNHKLYPVRNNSKMETFNSATLSPYWLFLRNPYADDWSLTQRPGWLRLNGSAITLDSLASPAFVGRRQQHFEFNATTLVDFKPTISTEEAGITALASNQNRYEIAIRREGNHRSVFVRFKLGCISNEAAREEIPDGLVYLRISGKGLYYFFSYSLDNKNFKTIAKANTRFLSAEVVGGFTGVVLGMYATGNGRKSMNPADFEWFEYNPLSE